MMKDFNLRKITCEDYDFIYNVKKKCYKKYVEYYYGKWNDKDQREYFGKFIDQVKDNAYIIEVDGVDIGFYNGEDIDNDTYEIGNICILEKYQGRGIGTKILTYILEKYKNQNITIQYFKINPVGNLYKRLGFVLDGESEFHFQMIKRKKC